VKLAAAAAVLLIASCPRGEGTPSAAPAAAASSAQELRVEEGTAARLDGDVQVGAGNFWEEGGQLTCGLWVTEHASSAAPPAQQEPVRVRKGQVVERAGRKIEVVDVTRQGDRGVVVLRVSKP
jgi:hypothetical protein